MAKILYSFIRYTFVSVLLFLSLVIMVIRLGLPIIANDPAKVQHLLSEHIGHAIKAERIHAGWDGWKFNVKVHQMDILDLTQNLKIVQFDSVLVNINILQSLYKQAVIFDSIVISGANLTVKKQANRIPAISIKQYLADNLAYQTPHDSPIVTWLLSQKNIVIENSNILLVDVKNADDSLLLSDASFSINNNGYRTRISGTAKLPELYGDILNFYIDAKGDLLSPSWSAEVYLASQDIKIAALLKAFDIDIEDQQGRGDIALWGTWNHATLRELTGSIKLDKLKFHNNQASISIQQAIGDFLVTKRVDQGFELSLDIEKFSTQHSNWPESKFFLQKTQHKNKINKYKYLLNASYLNIQDIHDLINIIPHSSDILPLPNDLYLTGVAKNSVIKYDPILPDSQQFHIDTEFSDVTIQQHKPSIMLDALSGKITGTLQAGQLNLASSNTEIAFNELFKQAMRFSELNAAIDWYSQNNEVLLSTNQLNADNEDLNITLQGDLKFSQNNKLPFADISLTIEDGKLEKIVNYVPNKQLPKGLETWLGYHPIAGNISVAQITLNGWLAHYPFDSDPGNFHVAAKIDKGTLDYYPEWPKITNIETDLEVIKDTVTINAHSGSIFDAKIKKASAIIQDIADPDVKLSVVVNTEIDGSLNDGAKFINNSPLKVPPVLKNLLAQKISGDMGLVLDLDIPLGGRGESAKSSFNGTVSVLNGVLAYKDVIDITLTELNGLVAFSQDSISAKNIKGNYFEYPISLGIEHHNKTSNKVTLHGIADAKFLNTQLLHYFPEINLGNLDIEKYITGQSAWEATLFFTHKTGDDLKEPKQLIIDSNLAGLGLNFPAPMQKEAASIIPLQLSINSLVKEKRNIQIQYGDSTDGLLFDIESMQGKKTRSPTAFFAEKDVKNNYKKLNISGNIKNLMTLEWLDILTNESSTMGDMEKYSISLDIHTNSMDILDHTFSDVAIKLDDMHPMYHLNMDAAKINGDAYISKVDNEETMRFKVNKLHLVPNESSANIEKALFQAIPQNIPPLDIHITELIYNDTNLGEMQFSTTKKHDGLAIDNIQIQNEDFGVTGNGAWEVIDDTNFSKFDLVITTASIQSLLEILSYEETVVEGNHTKLALNVGWQGTPTDFSLNHMEGDLKIKIKQGQLMNVNPLTNRLLGLLSITTLPKRLLLDFSDVFSEGIAFHTIHGLFKVGNGQISTDNLLISGYSVNMHFAGTTDIVNKTYDKVITIIPKLSNSIPLAGAILGGPVGIGVGATIFLAKGIFQFLPDEIDSMLLKQYQLTGDWENPEIIQVPHPFATQDTRSISDWSPRDQQERK